jgi:hypothetical protein
VASIWTFGDNAGDQTEVKIKHVFTAFHEFPWLKRKTHSKVQRVSVSQVEDAGMLYRPACKDAYKRKSWAVGPQSEASNRHRHTPRENNLNYTIWTLYAESVSISL